MKLSGKLTLILLSLLIASLLIIGGCSTTAKKPYQQDPASPPGPAKTNVKTPAADNNYRQMANRVDTAADKVNGVSDATVVVSGKMIYVGLDLDANLGLMTSTDVEKAVTNKIKNMEPNYTVYVASDADTVTRIKNVAEGITQGKPLSSFENELKNIGNRIKPSMK